MLSFDFFYRVLQWGGIFLSALHPLKHTRKKFLSQNLESKERTQQSLGRDCWVLSPSCQDPVPVTETGMG